MIAPEVVGLAMALASQDAMAGHALRTEAALSADLVAHGARRGWPILRQPTLAKAFSAYVDRYAVAAAPRRTVAA
ncbi:MAG: hypothetical protein NVSMB31_01320 [Vulcanimicrobiaceae bacterium]